MHSQTLASSRILTAEEFSTIGNTGQQVRSAQADSVQSIKSLHDNAWDHGYRDGMRQALTDVANTCRRARDDADGVISNLTFAVLRKVLGQADPKVIVQSIAQWVIFDCCRELETLTVRVHPSVAEQVGEGLAALPATGLRIHTLADPQLSPTGCVIDTAFGTIEADLDSQLDALQHAVCGPHGTAG